MGSDLTPTLSLPLLAPAPSKRAEVEESAADALAMRRLAAGDVETLGVLYDRHQAAVRRFAARMTGNDADADDVVHATFMALMKSAASYDPERSFRPWLLGIAAHVMRRQRTSFARWARLLDSARPPRPASSSDPERVLAAREQLGHLDRALARMSDAKRSVLMLAEVEGLSGEQIADALGIPIGTVWTRLHHARRELLAALPREEGA